MPSTTNFSWTTPSDTDLVKDGALAIRTLGNGIDTSLVDLKGGTTGQVLTKATNTDLDYSWTDVISASNAFLAGKNKIINGAFDWNQRAFSSTTTTATYTYDRWLTSLSDGTTTVSAQVFTPGTAPVAGYEGQNFVRLVSSGQTLTSARSVIQQRIEDVRTFAGQTVTVSFWAKAGSGTPSVAANFQQVFGAGGSTTVNVNGQKSAITTSWARYSWTFSIPSVSGKTIGTASYLQLRLWTSSGSDESSQNASLGIQSATIDFWGVQVEAGSVATAFQTATGTIQGELAACQRYYWRMTSPAAASPFGNAYATSTTAGYAHINYPVEMRTSSGVTLDYSTIAFYLPGTAVYGATAATISTNTRLMALLSVTGMTGLTANRPYSFTDNNSTSGYIGISAEL